MDSLLLLRGKSLFIQQLLPDNNAKNVDRISFGEFLGIKETVPYFTTIETQER